MKLFKVIESNKKVLNKVYYFVMLLSLLHLKNLNLLLLLLHLDLSTSISFLLHYITSITLAPSLIAIWIFACLSEPFCQGIKLQTTT